MAHRDVATEAQEETLFTIPIKRLILYLSLTVGCICILFLIWMATHNRYVVTVDLKAVDAPRKCWEASEGGIFSKAREAKRDRAPGRAYLGYCGGVLTSHGSFLLPESLPRPWLGQSRAEMHDRLRRGCRYDLVVLSENGRPTQAHGGRTTRNPPRIRRIMFSYPC